MTVHQTAEVLFKLSDEEDEFILNTMLTVISKEELYIDDTTFYCIRELLQFEKQGGIESQESSNWIVNAWHTRCSRCKIKKQNYEYFRAEKG